MKTMLIEKTYNTIREAAHALADDLAETLHKAILSRGKASLAVSGGNTPSLVFEKLRKLDVDWSRVTITLTDERWVPNDHPDSNEKLVRTFLLQGRAEKAAFVPLFGGEETPRAGQSACEQRLSSIALPFDAVYLGIGGDGHFASLFPGDPAVDVKNSLCTAVPANESRVARMSLTAPQILSSPNISVLFSGADKHAVYKKAKKAGSNNEIPLRMVLNEAQFPVKILSAP